MKLKKLSDIIYGIGLFLVLLVLAWDYLLYGFEYRQNLQYFINWKGITVIIVGGLLICISRNIERRRK